MNRKARSPTGCKVITALALAFCFIFVFVPYNKLLNNLNRSVVTGKPRPTVLTSLSLAQYGEASV